MPLEPEKITREHVLKAVRRIREEEIDLISSTGYDVIIDGEKYPPKDLMRYAHEEMNGEHVWKKGGGESTNRYLREMGFEIVNKGNQVDYFDLEKGLSHYQEKVGQMYQADDPAADWWKETRKKLNYLVELLDEELGEELEINYSERPNGQAGPGRIEFKDYVITGCKPKEVKANHLFIKLAIHKVNKEPKFDIDIDGNWRSKEQIHTHDSISALKEKSTYSIPINSEFPNEWSELVAEIKEPFKKALKLYKEVHASMKSKGTLTNSKADSKKISIELNQILYGPPGTGKTYHTVNKALQIVDPEFYEEHKNDRKVLTNLFRELLFLEKNDSPKDWRIAFATFHQSFTYEDFVEGIKPILEDEKESKGVRYQIEDGIFKRICVKARYAKTEKEEVTRKMVSLSGSDFRNSQFYKVSLGNSNNEEDDIIYEYCKEQNKIAIGHLGYLDLTNKSESDFREIEKDDPEASKGAVQMMNYFVNYLKKGDYVVVSNGNKHARAVGKIVGDYEYKPDSKIRYPHFREVEWLLTDEQIPVDEIYGKDFQMQPIYMLKKDWLNKDFFKSKEDDKTADKRKPDSQNYVLIIDEINRGNISQIFGELITLIEADKREGEDEELSAILPYSKKVFSVPSNVYLMGTMNTADRSIEALDTALRRRFAFEEMPPKPKVIEEEGALKEEKSEILVGESYFKLSKILETINKRVEKLLDKDHLIGHSYFMDVKKVSDLQRVFYRNIIPLLEEYFYGDKGKIQLVLGRGFIRESDHSGETNIFARSNYGDGIFDDREVWELTYGWRKNETEFVQALKILLNEED